MVIVYLIVGILLGAIGAGISLLLGSSALLALAVYAGVGSLGVLLLAAFHYAWAKIMSSVRGRGKKTRRSDAVGLGSHTK